MRFFTWLAWPARTTAKVLNDLADTTTGAVNYGDPILGAHNGALAAALLTGIYAIWALAAAAFVYIMYVLGSA